MQNIPKIILLFTCFFIFKLGTAQDLKYKEVACETKEVEFISQPNFEFNVKNIITFEKRAGVYSMDDILHNEKKKILKSAKKLKCCKVIYVLDGNTPHGLSLPDEEAADVFRFYIVKEVRKM